MTDSQTPQQILEDHAQLKALLATAVDGIITIDERGIIEDANPAAERLFGYSVQQMVGSNVSMLMPSPYSGEHDRYLENYLRTGIQKIIGVGREVEGLRSDGSTFPIYLAVSEVRFGERRIFTGFVHDLTDVRKAEEQATQFGRILEDSLNEIYIFDAKTLRFLHANRGALTNTRYSLSELLQLTPADIKPDFTEARIRKLLEPLLSGKESVVQFETVHRRRDDSVYDVLVRIQCTDWEDTRAFVATILDITSEKAIQRELADRDHQIRFMVEHLPAAAAYVDTRTGAVRFNSMIKEITGFSPTELSDLDSCFQFLFRNRSSAINRLYRRTPDSWNGESLRLKVNTKDGGTRIVEMRGYRYDDHEVWLMQDITERDRHEMELMIRNQAIQSASEGVVIADATQEDCPIIFVNQAFEVLSGYSTSESLGHSCELLLGANPANDSLVLLKSAIHGHQEFRTTLKCFRKDGSAFWNEISVAPVRTNGERVTHVVAVMEDVSERREAQKQLLQSERLAAIGQMVTGLAHESRNALQRAQACLDMLSLDLEDSPDQLELTDKARRALDDLHRLYEEVRNYAAPINLDCRPTDVAKVWRDTWRNLEAMRAGRDFRLVESEFKFSTVCSVDGHRMEQVFRNIMENSLAACTDPGVLHVECSECTRGEKPGLKVIFHDNGPGITTEQAQTVFQPFFTTRQKGTGLGLAIARRIVEAHGGSIFVDYSAADAGSGARLCIEIPR